jgi:hypothetical protein
VTLIQVLMQRAQDQPKEAAFVFHETIKRRPPAGLKRIHAMVVAATTATRTAD